MRAFRTCAFVAIAAVTSRSASGDAGDYGGGRDAASCLAGSDCAAAEWADQRVRLKAFVDSGLAAGPPSRTELVYSEVRLQTDGLGGHVYRASPLLGIASLLGLGVSGATPLD